MESDKEVEGGSAIATVPTEPAVLQDTEVFVIARNGVEMARAQKSLVDWARSRSARTAGELSDALANYEIAKESKWRTAPFEALVRRIEKRLHFYEKVTLALEAGYVIVPEMDLELIAIRTKKKHPRPNETSSWSTREQESEAPAPGEGRYVQPEATDKEETRLIKDGAGKLVERTYRWADEFKEEMDFPFRLAKPEVLSATDEAMALRVFDEIGVLPKSRRRGDPMVIGRVFLKEGYRRKEISFVIAWYIDTRDL